MVRGAPAVWSSLASVSRKQPHGVETMAGNPAEPLEQDPVRVPVIAEELAVGTRVVDTGRGVRIHKSVVEQPVTIDERLGREEEEVRHVPVDRIVAPDDAPANRYEGDTLVVP